MDALAEWQRRGDSTELRTTAAVRIRAAIANADLVLNLSGLGLTDLPSLPRHVECLDVHGNRLTTLAEVPPSLVALNAGSNPGLRRLPALPETLRALHAASCALADAPESWPSDLWSLSLARNRLTVVPVLPSGLWHCDLSDNDLTDIPANLFRLRITEAGEVAFNLAGNPLNAAAAQELAHFASLIERIVSRTQDATSRTGTADGTGALVPVVRLLGMAAMAWFPVAAQLHKAGEWAAFQHEAGADAFSAFLDALQDSPWGKGVAFRDDMRAWLDRLAGDAELRATTFATSLDATQTCHDRVLHALFGMRMQALLADVAAGRYDDHPAELVELAAGFQAYDALMRLAQGIVAVRVGIGGADEANEELEVSLALMQKYGHRLPPVVRNAPMLYEFSAELTAEHYAAVERELRTLAPAFKQFLSNWEPVQHALKRWNPARYAAADQQLREQLENETFVAYQRALGFTGMAAVEAMRRDVFAPLLQDWIDANGLAAAMPQITHL